MALRDLILTDSEVIVVHCDAGDLDFAGSGHQEVLHGRKQAAEHAIEYPGHMVHDREELAKSVCLEAV